jgi:hypothetical protein
MATQIKRDVQQALADWKAGKPVKSIELGQVHRMKEQPGGHSPVIDLSVRLQNDQERAHAYCFHLIELFQLNGIPQDHKVFLEACDEYEQIFDWGELPVSEKDVFDSERNAAEGLAWKALLIGWNRAIAGHDPSMYIEVTNPTVSRSLLTATETAT